MIVIPAIDLINAKCVRLFQGDYSQKQEYDASPLEIAKKYEDAGCTHLHLVDLDGAKAAKIINYNILKQITNQTNLKVDFGGGLRTNEDLKIAFESGATQITAGSIAIQNPEQTLNWINKFGASKIIIGADSKDKMIAINGWIETTDQSIITFINDYEKHGVKYVIATDVAKDGAMQGPSFELYAELQYNFPSLKIVASGGVRSVSDLKKLQSQGLYGAIVGKALLDGHIKLEELKEIC